MSEENWGQNEVGGEEGVEEVGAVDSQSEDVVEAMGVGAEAMNVIEDEWECGERELTPEKWVNLREILVKDPSTEVFAELVEFFIEGDLSDVAYGYVENHIEDWADELKMWPKKYSDLILDDKWVGRNLRVMRWMRGLDLSHCSSLEDVDALSALTNLVELNLSHCSSLENVDGLSGLTNLEKLNLSGCDSLEHVDGLSELTNLKKLDLRLRIFLKKVDVLIELTNLKKLNLWGCGSLDNVEVLSGLTNLVELSLWGGKSLESVDELIELTNLKKLRLAWCESLENVDVLSGLTNLKELDLSFCRSLENVEVLSGLTNLKKLSLRGCSNLNLSEEQIEIFRERMGDRFKY